jgi:TrpR family trp operon transcriptional repressor
VDRVEEIATTLAVLADADLIERFIRSILTTAEVRLVSSRWELVKMLKAGKSQRAIAKELGLSLCKITRGSRELKGESSALRRIIEIFENLPKES